MYKGKHGPPRFVKRPVKKKKEKESREMGFELGESGEIWQRGRRQVQADGAMKTKERSPTDFRLRLGIFKSFLLEDRKARDV